MATKESDIRGGYANLCKCCRSPQCGKRKGPWPKKRKPYLDGQKQRVNWRSADCPNVYNNDYVAKLRKDK